MRDDEERSRTFSRRSLLIGAGQLGLFGVIAGRLYQLQVLDADVYRTLAEENRINLELLPPARGRVLDRNGLPIAGNEQTLGVVLVPEQTNGVEPTLDVLSRIVPLTDLQRQRVMKEVARNRSFMPVSVSDDLNWSEFSRINVVSPDLPGVHGQTGLRRSYPLGPAFAHIVGYVGPASEADRARDPDPLLAQSGFQVGRQGIERRYDKQLRGVAGKREVEVNALGRVIRELSREEGVQGKDLRLTIDTDLQTHVTELMDDVVGSAVVMDVQSGDLVAMVSTPGFDPNSFVRGMQNREWTALRDHPHAPLLNRSVGGRYPPGSTFKIAVLAAALEAGIATRQRRVYCNGHVELGGRRFHCWHRQGHGMMNYTDAMRESCDVYFYEIAKEVGIDRISDMAERLGLGQRYDLPLEGMTQGLLPTQRWKQIHFGKQWQMGETLNAGIGQGDVLATPLELAVMTARVADGRRAVKPRLIIDDQPDEAADELDVQPCVMDALRQGLFEVVNHPKGTAHHAKIKSEFGKMAGKTGTAQVRGISKAERESGVLKNEELIWRQRDHALFVAYAPVKAPRFAVSVLVEHGGSGSGTAAPLARDIMNRALAIDRGVPADEAGDVA